METNRLEYFGACYRIEAHISGMCLGLIVLLLVYANLQCSCGRCSMD
jgi:hypothetical protein